MLSGLRWSANVVHPRWSRPADPHTGLVVSVLARRSYLDHGRYGRVGQAIISLRTQPQYPEPGADTAVRDSWPTQPRSCGSRDAIKATYANVSGRRLGSWLATMTWDCSASRCRSWRQASVAATEACRRNVRDRRRGLSQGSTASGFLFRGGSPPNLLGASWSCCLRRRRQADRASAATGPHRAPRQGPATSSGLCVAPLSPCAPGPPCAISDTLSTTGRTRRTHRALEPKATFGKAVPDTRHGRQYEHCGPCSLRA
jgi:hypothetical protein